MYLSSHAQLKESGFNFQGEFVVRRNTREKVARPRYWCEFCSQLFAEINLTAGQYFSPHTC